jgi:hypothetical protein
MRNPASWTTQIRTEKAFQVLVENILAGRIGDYRQIHPEAFSWHGWDQLPEARRFPILLPFLRQQVARALTNMPGLHESRLGSLDPRTQVGYIEPRYLDYLESLRQKHALRGRFYGGERRAGYQSTPLLVASTEELPDFFAQEIPAYVLAARPCKDILEAIAMINHYNGPEPRLAVAFLNFPRQQLGEEILSVRAHAVLVDRPTTTLLPAFHEGNDYALQLGQSRYFLL